MIYIFTRNLLRVGMLSAVESLHQRQMYNGIGTFTIICGATDRNVAMIKADMIVHQDEFDGIIKNVTYVDGKINANGFTLNEILNQRTFLNAVQIKNIADDLYNAINANKRDLDVVTGALPALDKTTDTSITGGQICDNVVDVCSTVEFGNRCYIDIKNSKKVFEIYSGQDLTGKDNPKAVNFSTERGTLGGLEISNDASDFKNVAIVAGQGTNEQRTLVVVGSATAAERYELYVDARDLQQRKEQSIYDANGNEIGTQPAETDQQYLARLAEHGKEKLAEHVSRLSFNAVVSAEDYGKKFKLGDLVNCNSARYGVKFKARISEVNTVIDAQRKTVSIVLGDPKLDVKGMVKLWQN